MSGADEAYGSVDSVCSSALIKTLRSPSNVKSQYNKSVKSCFEG